MYYAASFHIIWSSYLYFFSQLCVPELKLVDNLSCESEIIIGELWKNLKSVKISTIWINAGIFLLTLLEWMFYSC